MFEIVEEATGIINAFHSGNMLSILRHMLVSKYFSGKKDGGNKESIEVVSGFTKNVLEAEEELFAESDGWQIGWQIDGK